MAFRSWLNTQTRRTDPVGDFARDVVLDGRCPPNRSDNWATWRRHLEIYHQVSEGILALFDDIWREYREATGTEDPPAPQPSIGVFANWLKSRAGLPVLAGDFGTWVEEHRADLPLSSKKYEQWHQAVHAAGGDVGTLRAVWHQCFHAATTGTPADRLWAS